MVYRWGILDAFCRRVSVARDSNAIAIDHKALRNSNVSRKVVAPHASHVTRHTLHSFVNVTIASSAFDNLDLSDATLSK